MTGREIAERAKEQLAELTGYEPATVSGMFKDEEGWHVNVDMIELHRIPNTTDVLAVYETLFDEEGNLISYERTDRYMRSQVTEVEEE